LPAESETFSQIFIVRSDDVVGIVPENFEPEPLSETLVHDPLPELHFICAETEDLVSAADRLTLIG
jgi:hypothetical protein